MACTQYRQLALQCIHACDDSGDTRTGELPYLLRACMPRRAVALGAIGVALLVVANVAVFQRRQSTAGGSLRAQVLKFAAAEVATGALEGSSSLPLPPPPPPTSLASRPLSTPVDGQIAEKPADAPTGTTTTASALNISCPAGMQTATDLALSKDPSTDCTRRHVFANGIQACFDHVRVQQGRYSRVNLHEPSEEELLARVLALIRPGDVFVDVGAAIGYYTLLVASTVCT